MKDRARRGGEMGVNGEWYAGGQFLPSSPAIVKGQQNGGRGHSDAWRTEIALNQWDYVPEGMCSIWTSIAGTVARYNRETGQLEYAASWQTLRYFHMTEAQARDLIARWNAGERWEAREAMTQGQ